MSDAARKHLLRHRFGKIDLLRWLRRRRLSTVERAIVSAQGKALALLLTALQARGHIDVRDFVGTLGVFSVVVGEDDDLEGQILAVWAGLIEDSL